MVTKTPRMQQIEAMLAEDPKDSFLRYGLAMEYISHGDDATGVMQLQELLAEEAYVPAYLMAAQALNRLGRDPEACTVLQAGIEAARLQGNDHALSEMQSLLAILE